MDIVIIANFCGTLDATANNRFLYLAKMLCKEHSVELITGDFCHSKKEYFSHNVESCFPFKVTMLHEPFYGKNVSLKRFYSHRCFGKNVDKYLKNRRKPDVILSAVPSLTAALKAGNYCKKQGVRFIVDIQDLWPEAYKMVLNIPIVSDMLFSPMARMADKIYRNADKVVGVSKTYTDRAAKVNKAAEKIVVFLGTDMETFDSYAKPKENRDVITIVYIGTLGHSYDLDTMFSAVANLNSNKKIKVLVMGEGPLRAHFEATAQSLNVNAEFTSRLPYEEMVARLSQCDIAVNPIKKGSAGSIINKVGDYAMAGLPVVNSQEAPEYRSLLAETASGINCICEDAEDMSKALQNLVDNDELRAEIGKNSRLVGSLFFDRAKTYKAIEKALLTGRGE